MMSLVLAVSLFAQEQPAAAPSGLQQILQFAPFAAIGLLFFFLILRPQQREQQRRDVLLKAIKKNDRVLTTGGIFGVVTNVQQDVNEVTIRVDEKNDTKLRVQLSSIARVLIDGETTDGKPEAKT